MKIYIVESNIADLKIFLNRESAENSFETIKTKIITKYTNSTSDIESHEDEFYVYTPCEDCCYEGQEYYVKLHEKEIKE